MITILCAGSRGDYQPYIALAKELLKNNKDVQIVGNNEFMEFVEENGVPFRPLNIDLDQLNIDPRMLEQAGSADNPLKMMLAFNKMKEYGEFTVKEYYEACLGSELIIYHPGLTIGYFAAEEIGIPSILALPFPMHKTNEYLSVVMYGKSKPTKINKMLSYKMIQEMLWMASKGSVKSFLKKKNGNLPKSFGAPYEKHNDKNHPALVSCSNHVFNRPKDWNENVHQYGYWFLDPKDDYVPDQELLDFINDGEKPIYIGFGSMSMMKRHKNLENLVFEAIKKSGKRAIVRGFGDLGRRDDSTFVVGNVPHTWLFSKVSGVCHHGGAGTTAAGFKAGVPSLIIPFSNDQFAWAHRAFDIGVGVSPIYVDKLTVESFAKSLCDLDDEILIENSKKLAENIKDENGLKNSVDVILELLGECNE